MFLPSSLFLLFCHCIPWLIGLIVFSLPSPLLFVTLHNVCCDLVTIIYLRVFRSASVITFSPLVPLMFHSRVCLSVALSLYPYPSRPSCFPVCYMYRWTLVSSIVLFVSIAFVISALPRVFLVSMLSLLFVFYSICILCHMCIIDVMLLVSEIRCSSKLPVAALRSLKFVYHVSSL